MLSHRCKKNWQKFPTKKSLINFKHLSFPHEAENAPNNKNYNNCLPEENEVENDPESQGSVLTGDSSSNSLNYNQMQQQQQQQIHQPAPNSGDNTFAQMKKQHPPQLETTAPAIDFKLNVKIDINSGKCVLHANKTSLLRGGGNSPGVGTAFSNSKNGADSLFANNYPFQSSAGGGSNSIPPSFMSFPTQTATPASEQELRNTNFIFPAIGVKAFYESNHKKIENKLAKKANLYAMIKLESFVMPHHPQQQSYPGYISRENYNSRDMCISPALLDFLEQTLEPFDLIKASFESATLATTPAFNKINKNFQENTAKSSRSSSLSTNDEFIDTTMTNAEIFSSNNSIALRRKRTNTSEQNAGELFQQQQQETTAYFPVDVVVFVSMFPSSVRFTCLPHSTMECLLKLPTLEMIFSTNRLDESFKERLSAKLNSDNPENIENIFKSISLFFFV